MSTSSHRCVREHGLNLLYYLRSNLSIIDHSLTPLSSSSARAATSHGPLDLEILEDVLAQGTSSCTRVTTAIFDFNNP